MKAEIIAIGTELLMGQTTDTNSSWLATQLPALGIDLYFMSQVGDNLGRAVDTLQRAVQRSDLVLTTGGLGPTEDDLTREAIAAFLKEPMYVDPALKEQLIQWFQSRGGRMAERNIKQAMLTKSASPLGNPRGTAPGWWVEKDGHIIVAMPGPPREMQRMWEFEVAPRLKQRLTGEAIVSRLIKTFGIPEGTLDEMLGDHLHGNNPTIGVYSKTDGIHLRLTAKAGSEAQAWTLLSPLEAAVRQIVGQSLWGTDQDSLEGIVGTLFTERGMTLATMESATGGLIASTIADNPDALSYFKGGIVALTPSSLVAHGVEADLIERFGMVSKEVAEDMARAARAIMDSDVGIGITGVSSVPDSATRATGAVHYAISHAALSRGFSANYPQGRLVLKQRAASAVLFELQRFVSSLSAAGKL